MKHNILQPTLILLFIIFSVPRAYTQEQSTRYHYPILFTQNVGQWNKSILYASLKGNNTACFARDGLTLMHSQNGNNEHAQLQNLHTHETPALKSELISLRFIHPSKDLKVTPHEKAVSVSQFYNSNDQSKWKEKDLITS